MPRYKQPSDLEQLALHSLRKYICDIAYSMLCGTHKVNFSALHKFLYSELPGKLCDKISQEILIAASEMFTEIENSTKCFEKEPWSKYENVMESMVLLSIHPQLGVLNMIPWQLWAQEVLCRNLYSMSNLRVLELDVQFPGWLDEELVIIGLSCMTGLLSFSMYQYCSDRILAALSCHCTQLQTLIVTCSRDITDCSIEPVRSFRNLRCLSLLYTSIKTEGFHQLLSKETGKTHPFSLHMLELSFMKSCHLNLNNLVNIWPNLYRIYLDNIQDDLSGLALLNKLREVKLCACNFFTHNIKGLLLDRGKHLISLEFISVKDVDILLVCQTCPRLRTLSLRNCSLLDITSSSLTQLQPTHEPFQLLEHLALQRNYNLYHLPLLLRFCVNIRTLKISDVADVFVYFMDDVLSRNSLKHLEEFRIGWNRSLTMRTVRLLVEHCPRLSVIGGLQRCTQISKMELESFRQELTASNLDIHIVK
ncbi:hypothetical protein L9F63_003861 [Diploptera punctata]|uniref:Uncharacterized protein n=1 Tax=Diploptera punctata TaxID=6984 RepID=A0AAD7ZKJ6_DIPPU|nr:hypothetical protein L9F63_003861 [Diploptera punctata]